MADWVVGAARDLPLDDSDSWDGGEAEKSIWAVVDPDDDNDVDDADAAKRAFCFQDASAPHNRGSYKDPFAHYVDGKLKAVKGGVDAAVRRIPDTDGPGSDQKDSAIAAMKAYQDRFGEDNDASRVINELWRPSANQVFPTVARTLVVQPTEELMALAKDRALDPDIFDESPPYFWKAQASNQRLDAYGTKMQDSSLRNYAQDATDGVAFQNSHRASELSFGRSILGRYRDARSSSGKSTEATFYTIPNLNLNGVNTDELIRGFRSGIVSDVSIGFYGGNMTCSICDRDIWDIHCDHISFWGRSSDERDANGEAAFIWVNDAHLAEVSAVYDGATPGAGILKAQREMAIGRLKPSAARFIEAHYRIRLPDPPPTRFHGIDIPKEERAMPENKEATAAATSGVLVASIPEESIRSLLTEFGVDATLEPMAGIRHVCDELKRLRPLADDGRAYRVDLIDEALKEGVRAMGEGFAQESYKSLLEGSSIEIIKRMRDDWAKTGDSFFAANGTKAGGRATDLGRGVEDGRKEAVASVPASAYR